MEATLNLLLMLRTTRPRGNARLVVYMHSQCNDIFPDVLGLCNCTIPLL